MANTYKVHFVSNRNPIVNSQGRITGFGPNPSQAQGVDLRYGEVQVAVTGAPKQGKIVPGTLLVYDEKILVEKDKAQIRGSDQMFSALHPAFVSAKTIILFAHGFFNTFSDSVERAATILSFYGIDAEIIVFSWPSAGTLIGYQHDRTTSRQSGPAFARVIRRVASELAGLSPTAQRPPVHLLCHSMGNYVLRFGVQALLAQPQETKPGEFQPAVPGDASSDHLQSDHSRRRRRGLRRVRPAGQTESAARPRAWGYGLLHP